jgi:hypothetical protein
MRVARNTAPSIQFVNFKLKSGWRAKTPEGIMLLRLPLSRASSCVVNSPLNEVPNALIPGKDSIQTRRE